MTIHWKAVERYFTVVVFAFQFYPVCNFEQFIRFGGLGTVRSERVRSWATLGKGKTNLSGQY